MIYIDDCNYSKLYFTINGKHPCVQLRYVVYKYSCFDLKMGEPLMHYMLCVIFMIKVSNILVDSFDKFTSACYLYKLALLCQAVGPCSPQTGTFQRDKRVKDR